MPVCQDTPHACYACLLGPCGEEDEACPGAGPGEEEEEEACPGEERGEGEPGGGDPWQGLESRFMAVKECGLPAASATLLYSTLFYSTLLYSTLLYSTSWKTKEYDTCAHSMACSPVASAEQEQHMKTREYDTEDHQDDMIHHDINMT